MHTSSQRATAPTKSPMVHRLLLRGVVYVLAMTAVVSPALGQDTWTAEDAVAHALVAPQTEQLTQARVARVQADVDADTTYPLPTLGLEYEQIPGDALEFTAKVEQEFDLSAWRARKQDAVQFREAAARAELDAWRLEVAVTVRTAFYEVRMHQERVAVLDNWIARLRTSLASIEARKDSGDASVYETRRIERELEIALAQRVAEQASLAEAWSVLDTWTDWDSEPTLVGDLPPTEPTADRETLPELVRLEQEQRALDAESNVWSNPFWRAWTVGAGYRYVDAGQESGHGFLVSLEVPLPFWNSDNTQVAALEAQQAEIGGELALREDLGRRAEAAAETRLTHILENLDAISSPERDAELTQMAVTAFGADEATLTDLLDAFESEAELQLARIDLQWEARRAAIDLERRRGIGVPQ